MAFLALLILACAQSVAPAGTPDSTTGKKTGGGGEGEGEGRILHGICFQTDVC